MPSTDRNPWERMEAETGKAWAAFICYRDMGPDRSLAKAGRELGKSKPVLERWSSRWLWVMRVTAWDTYCDERLREMHMDELAKMAKRHVQLAMGIQGIGAEVFKRAHKKEREKPGSISDNLSLTDATKLVKEAVTIERVARGEPGTVEESRDTDVDSAMDRASRRLLDDPRARLELDRVGARARGLAVDSGEPGGDAEPGEVAED